MKTVNLETDYEVAETDVILTVVVGDAQIGASVVKLNTKTLGMGEIAKLLVGSGPKVRRKNLYIKTAVTDVNDSTDHTSLTYRLGGGKNDREFISSATVDQDGDSIVYRAKFHLV